MNLETFINLEIINALLTLIAMAAIACVPVDNKDQSHEK